MKMLRVDDDVHLIIKELAKMDDRPITAYLNRHFRHFGQGLQIEQGVPEKSDQSKVLDLINNPETIKKAVEGSMEKRAAVLYPETLEKNTVGATPSVSSLHEQACCLNELAPCKHWVWDTQTGDGYKNSLSGRLMEVEG